MARTLRKQRVDHVVRSWVGSARTVRILRMCEDREELCVDAARLESVEILVGPDFVALGLGEEPWNDPVELGVSFIGVGTVHPQVEVVVEDPGPDVVVAIDDDGRLVHVGRRERRLRPDCTGRYGGRRETEE